MAQQSDNGSLNFSIGLNTDALAESAKRAQEQFSQIAESAKSAGEQMDKGIGGGANNAADEIKDLAKNAKQGLGDVESVVKSVTKAAAAMGVAFGAKELIGKIVEVRGEMQQLDVAFTTMLGDARQADTLMQQLVQTAATTPFGLTDVANGAKQLLAYGLAADQVNNTLIRLGDIAAGLSIPLNDLVYLYGTTMAQGRLYTQDLNQFTGRGIPMLGELAKQFGVAESEVKGLVESGKVGFPQVQKVIESLTNEGGKFGGLMEAQSKTITGQISNIEDALDMMFNDIGQQSEGVINTTLDVISSLVENYERVGRTIVGVAAAYGIYRTALMIAAAAEGFATVQEGLHYKALLLVEAAQKRLNASMLTNPWFALAAAIGVVVVSLASMKTEQDYLKEATDNYESSKQKLIDAEAEHKQKIEQLCDTASDESQATSLRRQALLDLEKQYPSIFAKYDTEADKLRNIANIKREIAELDGKKSFNEEKWNNQRINELKRKQSKTLYVTNSETGEINAIKGGGMSDEEKAELQVRLKKQRELSKTNQTKRTDDYFLNLGKTDANVLQYRKKQLDRMIGLGAKTGDGALVTSSDTALFGTVGYDVATLQAYYNKVQAEINRRAGKGGKSSGGKTGTSGKGGKNSGKSTTGTDEIEQAQKTADEKYKIEQQSAEQDAKLQELKNKTEQERINTITDNGEKQRAQLKLNHERELQELDSEKKDYLRQKTSTAKSQFDADPANKGKVFDYSSVTLTAEETAQFDERKKLLLQKQQQENNELTAADEKAHNEYLAQYGEYLEKRNAMIALADTATKNAGTQGEKDSIAAKLKQDLANLDFGQFKTQIHWDEIFAGKEDADPEVLKAINEQLQQFLDTASTLTPDQIKTIADAMTDLRDKMDLSSPIAQIKAARKEYATAKADFEKYATAYKKAMAAGDTNAASEAAAGMATSQQKMKKATDKSKKSFSSITGAVKEYAEALSDMGDTVGGTTGELMKLAASAISCGASMAAGIQQFQEAASNMERAVAVLAIIQAAMQALQIIVQLFGDTADTTLTDYVETLKVYIDLLNDSISDLNDSMSDAQNTMQETVAYYRQLVELEKESAAAIKSQSQVWLNSGAAKGFLGIGSSSSEGVKISKQIEKDLQSGNAEVRKFYQDGYNSLNEYFKKATGAYAKLASDFGRMDFIWTLSDEDLIKLSKDTKAMALLGDTLSQAITDYVAKLEQAKDDELSLGESLLSVSWDDFYDDFVDLVKDMDKTSEDFANNFAEYMRDALVKNMVASKYKSKIETLYKKAAQYAEDGTLDQHLNELREEYQGWADSAKKEVETINAITGYKGDTSSQDSASSGFESMSQETADELNGRFTALQMDTAAIRAEAAANFAVLNQNVGEIHNIALINMGHLEDISKNTHQLYEIKDTLTDIKKHTQRL